MMPTPTGPFASSVDVALPNSPGLIGIAAYAQWFATVVQCGIIPPCTFDALPTTNGAQLVLGSSSEHLTDSECERYEADHEQHSGLRDRRHCQVARAVEPQ